MTRGRRLASVALATLGTGVTSFVTAPSAGVGIHWSDDGGTGTVSPGAYAIGAALVVLAIGLYCTSGGREGRSARLDVVAAALLAIFCAVQGLFGLGVPAALGLAVVIAALTASGPVALAYTAVFWRARSD